jgi:hypothetical protein
VSGAAGGRVPPLPGPDLPAGFIWPAATGRAVLRQVPYDRAVLRGDLVGRQGLDDGSGTSDVLLIEAGDWCLKTSARRHFTDLDAGRAALLALARKKLQLGAFLPQETVLALVTAVRGDPGRESWLWTVCPWRPSLRRQMAGAVERGDEAALATALAAYASAATEAVTLASRHGVQLDVHPSNFALAEGGIWYLDDDIGTAFTLPAIGHALLHRVEEYARWEAAIDVYLSAFEEALPDRLSAAEARTLTEALEQTAARSAAAETARERLRRALRRCRGKP